jgi:hypothetical protein
MTSLRTPARWLLPAGTAFFGLIVGAGLGFASGTASVDPIVQSSPSPYPINVIRTYVIEKTAAPATSATKTKAPPVTIEDGTWTVGVDVPPGTYRPKAAAGEDCYWAILKSGTNGDDIISNNVGGGRPTVTLKKGQDFETARCGTWAKVG